MSVWKQGCIALAVACAMSAEAAELFPFRLPWDDASGNATNLSSWNSSPAGSSGFVRAENGHLYAGGGRIRFLGVNIVFAGVAPAHEEAERIAARLARFGVNAVRFHHMDGLAAPRGVLRKDLITFDPDALDRFDYFVAVLKKAGIYSDINLHVSRKYPGFTDWGETTPKYWKGVDNFFPPMIALQRDYARDLLTHRNPYTGNRYVEEPAVAFIEVNNENGLIREWRTGGLNGMIDPYRAELARRWQAWLKARYGDTAALRAAWGVREEPLGTEMLTPKLGVRGGERGWNLQTVGEGRATLAADDAGAAVLAMTQGGAENWHIQLHQNGLAFTADRPYTLEIALRADKPLKIAVQAMQAHAPWQNLWRRELTVGPAWQTVRSTFAPVSGDGQARLSLTGFGRSTGQVWLKDASLRPGGLLGLRPGEDLEEGAVGIFDVADFQGRTVPAQRDWIRFLWDVETAYWTGMRDYLRNDLGAKPLLIGTQATYSPAAIQGLFDVVDDHAYWQHVKFPGKPWDANDWFIENSPMAGVATGGTLPELALRRVAGKPFVVTEYNHAAPSHFQGEALPLLAAYGALQDWDGVFLYSFGLHGKSWDPGHIDNYFDSHANPVKMAGLIATAALLRRGDVASSALAAQTMPDLTVWIDAIRAGYRMPSAEMSGAARGETFIRPVGIGTPSGAAAALPYASVTGELAWGVNEGRTVVIDAARSKGLIGVRTKEPLEAGGVGLELLEARNDWGVLLATALDGGDFASPGRVLITTLGQIENTGQKWRDERKTTLGRDWGGAPSLVEGIGARVTLPAPAARVRAWALDERGNRREEIPVTGAERAAVTVGERYRTLWYEVEIR